jgi:O-antigen/teichoic acid export membrane protein
MTPTDNLLAGTLTKYVLLALNIGTGIFLMPFTVRHLGQTEYGLWMLVASMTYYFQLLDLGYGNGVVRHLIASDRRGDVADVNRIASTFVCVYAVLGFAVLAGTAFMMVVIVPRFPHLSPDDVRTARVLLAILGVRVAIGLPMTVFGAVTNARQGFVLNNFVAMAMVCATTLATYAILERGHGLIRLVLVTTAVNLAGYVGYVWTARHVFPGLRIRVGDFSRARWREVTTFSVYLFVIQLAAQISFNIDNIVVGAFLGTASVAVYTVALRLAEYQRRLCDQFSGMLYPVVLRFGADGDIAALRGALIEGTRLAVTMVVGASVCLIGFSGPLIVRWMGAAFAGSVVPFVALALAGVIVVSQAAAANVLIALGRHRLVAAVWIGEAVANLVLSLVLVRTLGLVGVAVGTTVPLVFGHLGVMLPAACRGVDLPVRRCAWTTGRPALAGAGGAFAVCAALRFWMPPATASAVVAEASLVALFYIATVLTIGFDAATRRLYRAHALNVWPSTTAAVARAAAAVPTRPARAEW